MAFASSTLVDSAKRKPTIEIRPGTQASPSRTSTFRPPSTVSVTRNVVPESVRYTPEGCRRTIPVYLPASGPGRGTTRERGGFEERNEGRRVRDGPRPDDRSGSADRPNVRRLGTLGSLGHVELDLLVLLQVAVPVA